MANTNYNLPPIFGIPNELYTPDRRTFGGEIYGSDFSTEYPTDPRNPNHAERIAQCWAFDRARQKDYEGLQRRLAHKKKLEAENV